MTVARNKSRAEARPYRKRARAESEAATRERIVEAAVELHLENGPARTSIQAIAERAGVNRVTVYRHFPDTRSLLEACSEHAERIYPPPDLASWCEVADARERLQLALPQLYEYFRRTEAGWTNLLRDAEVEPLVKEMVDKRRMAYLRQARDTLLARWPVSRTRKPLLRAVLGLAVDFRTWQTLVRREGLDDRTAVALMGRLAGAVGRTR